jgi:hypothetical protein
MLESLEYPKAGEADTLRKREVTSAQKNPVSKQMEKGIML